MMYPESCHNSQSIQTIDGLTRDRDDGGAGGADWQRRTELLACLACGHYRLLIGGLDLFLAGLAL